MWQELLTLWQSVRDPEYAHLLLESLPLYGIGIALLFLVASLAAREHKCRLLALLIICASSSSVWPYNSLREQAQPRILATHEPAYGPLIREQTQRRASTGWIYYSIAVVSSLALVLGWTGMGRFLVFLTVLTAVAGFWVSIWLHNKECEIYHRNIVKHVAPR